MNTTETIIYQSAGGQVSTARAVLNGVTYPISAISSVRMVRMPGSFWGGSLLLIGFFSALWSLVAQDASSWTITACLIGAGLWILIKVHAPWAIVLRTAGGETTALKSQNYGDVLAVTEAINQAIVARG